MNVFHGEKYKYAVISKNDSKAYASIQEVHLIYAMYNVVYQR